jgi:pimeloyl-ACP methyl ester carboxylesterase
MGELAASSVKLQSSIEPQTAISPIMPYSRVDLLVDPQRLEQSRFPERRSAVGIGKYSLSVNPLLLSCSVRKRSCQSGTYATIVSVKVERVSFQGFGGLKLAGDVRGNSEAWPVLFLHGGGQTRYAWGKTADVVAEHGWRAITLDHRGHGESDWSPNADYSFTAYCADCISVVDQLGRPPVMVGASLGGMVALLAEGTSDRTIASGLVLVDIVPNTNREGVKRIQEFMRSGVSGFATLDDAGRAIANYTPHRVRKFNPDGLKKVLRERDGRWYWHWDPQIIQQEHTEVVASKFMGLLEFAMGNIHVPTLVVRGLLSDVVTQEGIDDIVRRLPDVKVVEVEGAGHMIAGDQNDAFSHAVVTFLDEQIRPTLAF